jgi:myo-inositol 2-dehydrogenase/D-chiro-inositol 1-dehydrogenase
MKAAPLPAFSRRRFLGASLAAATAASLTAERARGADAPAPAPAAPPVYSRKIKLGVVGNGGRGAWIAKLFQAHGGYEMWAVADYFQEVADKCGDELGVDRARRFSTLSGYKKLIESGVEAVALEVPCYFFPEQARAAVEAGLHVYMAKPVAVDVPGALQILAAGQQARKQQRCFLVDYQMPTDPLNIEIVRRIHAGALGPIAQVRTTGIAGGFADPPHTATLESRLQKLTWVNDVALGCDLIGNYDIHAIDAALWVIGQRPVAAQGFSRVCRPDPHGDSRDVCSLVYEYADGLVHNHYGQALKNNSTGELSAAIYGTSANALLNYWGKAFLRGGPQHFGGGDVADLYKAGAMRNIARFHREVTEGNFANDTLERAVDGVLTCVLGYEAAARRQRLTMAALLQENKRLAVDLRGLKT